MGNNASKGGQSNFRKASKLKKQKIDKRQAWGGIGLCRSEYLEEDIWLSHFKSECSDLQESCQWASQVLYSLKKYEGYPVSYYQREITQCNFSGIFLSKFKQNLSKDNGCFNSVILYLQQENKKLKFNKIVSRSQSIRIDGVKKKKRDYDNLSPQIKYKKLYKKSDLIEEDLNGSFSLSNSILGNVVGPNNIGNKKSLSINSFSINNNHPNKGSFSSINSNPSYVFPQYLLHKNDITNQNREQIDALELYVLKTELISKHLQDPNNVLGHLFYVFFETFINAFEGISKRLYDLRLQNAYKVSEEKEIIQKAITEMQQFIRVMQETIALFYNLTREMKRSNSESKKNPTINHFNRENMLNFITSQIFKNKKLYEIIFTLLSLEDLQQEEQLKVSMKKLLKKKPQDFYIQDRLCLNERTLICFKKDNTKFIKEELENEYTGTESINAQGEVESNMGSDIKQQKRINKKYKSDNSLKEENEDDDDEDAGDDNYNFQIKQNRHQNQEKEKEEGEEDDEEEEEEEKQKDDEDDHENDDLKYCQFVDKNSSKKNQEKETKSKLRKTKTQDLKNENGISQTPTNQTGKTGTTTSSTQNPRRSLCKEVEYYYTSSFENQSDLLRDNNLNNSQPQSFPYSSKNQNVRGLSDFDKPIKEKVTEESQSESGSAVEDGKESSSSSSQNQSEIKRESSQIDGPDKIYFEKLKRESYYRSLKYIMRIQKQQSPIGKMKMIVKASEHILTCINSFYKNYGIQQNNFLDADDVLSIFSFFSCKCYIYNMNTHIKLISKFITSNLLNSVSGYYLTTLSASLQNILEFQNGSILQTITIDD